MNSNIFMDNSQILPYTIDQKENSSSIIVKFCKNDHFLLIMYHLQQEYSILTL